MGDGGDVVANIQDQIQALGLHRSGVPAWARERSDVQWEDPPSPAGISCLEGTILRAALSPCIPHWKECRTEHIPGRNAHLRPPHLPSHSRQIRPLRDPLYSFCTQGVIGPSPVHLSRYHSGEQSTLSTQPTNKVSSEHRLGAPSVRTGCGLRTCGFVC